MNAALRVWIAAGLLGLSVAAGPAAALPCAGFTDVEDTSQFCANVDWVRNRGITLGCTTTAYCPDSPVTRLQMAAFLSRLAPMLLPALYDADGVLLGYYFPAGGYSGPATYAAMQRNGRTYYVPIGAMSGTGIPFLRFSYSMVGTVYYELAGCSEAGRKWIPSYSTALSPNTAYVERMGGANWRLLGIRAQASGTVYGVSYRSSSDGVCYAGPYSFAAPMEMEDLGPITASLPLTIR